MKKLELFTMVGAFLLLTTNVMAQVTASATGTATIVTPIAITKTVDMNFGNVAVSSTLGTAVLAPAGTRTATGGVTLPATTGTVAAASFSVTGEGAYTYAITLPSTDYTITETVGLIQTMTVNTFTSTPLGTGTLTAGAQTLLVGATLNVGASQLAGVYTNATGFDVTVNYN
ncbi:MAG: hypothetical protein COC12_14420 [Rhodobacteraceae bacterium]|nr:DUF4402 domain-containing protein [Flavobacteriaceae bacterium]PCH65553.1 MAG: hypothetical protein COC12_14420 [Paracoccaceae bacterium]